MEEHIFENCVSKKRLERDRLKQMSDLERSALLFIQARIVVGLATKDSSMVGRQAACRVWTGKTEKEMGE